MTVHIYDMVFIGLFFAILACMCLDYWLPKITAKLTVYAIIIIISTAVAIYQIGEEKEKPHPGYITKNSSQTQGGQQ